MNILACIYFGREYNGTGKSYICARGVGVRVIVSS